MPPENYMSSEEAECFFPKDLREAIEQRANFLKELVAAAPKEKVVNLKLNQSEAYLFLKENCRELPSGVYGGLPGVICPGIVEDMISALGHKPVVCFLKYLESKEEYEACEIIHETLNKTNN